MVPNFQCGYAVDADFVVCMIEEELYLVAVQKTWEISSSSDEWFLVCGLLHHVLVPSFMTCGTMKINKYLEQTVFII